MLTLHPETLSKDGKKQFAVLPYEEFLEIQADADDLFDLRKAKKTEVEKLSISMADAKAQLGLN